MPVVGPLVRGNGCPAFFADSSVRSAGKAGTRQTTLGLTCIRAEVGLLVPCRRRLPWERKRWEGRSRQGLDRRGDLWARGLGWRGRSRVAVGGVGAGGFANRGRLERQTQRGAAAVESLATQDMMPTGHKCSVCQGVASRTGRFQDAM